MADYSFVESVQIRALASVLRRDDAYTLRRIFRWYSKNFVTPLHEVEELPVEEVLTAYYESSFEDMTMDEIREAAEELLATSEEKLKRKRQKDADEADDFDAEQMMVEHEKRRKKRLAAKKQKLGEVETSAQQGLLSVDLMQPPPTASLPLSNQQPPDVSVRFMDDGQIGKLLAADEEQGG